MADEKPKRVLDANAKQEVSFCVPLWLRDEQVKQNTARVKGRIAPHFEPRGDEPVAIVCFGSSLHDTIEEVRAFKYIFSCSGSHKYLIEHGIVPTWHVEVDPRIHKIQLLGDPHPDVEYLIASACHPKYFEHLNGFNVKLWHIFDASDDYQRLIGPGEWALTGGCGAGLRAMALARFMGFTNQHVFGMDGNLGDKGEMEGKSHASFHPNAAPDKFTTVVNGRTFRTTPSLLEAARQTWHELDDLKDVQATFHGDGLVQEMAKSYVRKPNPNPTFIGFEKAEVISEDFRALNAKLHADNLTFGVGGGKHADTVLRLMATLKDKVVEGQPSLLDYGCGKGYLGKALPFPIWEYDPAIPEKATPPRPADLVVCTDVLEHVEPDHLQAVLADLKRVVKQIGYFTIHTGPAVKTYADGRNTHLIQQPKAWWEKKLSRYFEIGKVFEKGVELVVLVGPIHKDKRSLMGKTMKVPDHAGAAI